MLSVPASRCSSLAMDWTTGVRSPAGAKDFSSILCVQTGSGAHSASCPMGTGGLFSGGKTCPGVTLTTHPHLVPRSWMSRSYNSPPGSPYVCFWTDFLMYVSNTEHGCCIEIGLLVLVTRNTFSSHVNTASHIWCFDVWILCVCPRSFNIYLFIVIDLHSTMKCNSDEVL
jgi:hypothetical protein